MIKTVEEFYEKIKSCSHCLEKKFVGEEGKRAIVLCGGTGCLSSHSHEIKEKFEQIIHEKGLEDHVTVNHVGCFGFCSQGPFVKIYPEDTLYRLVKLGDVEEIVEKDIIGHEIVERLLFVDPATKEKVAKQDDINFYKKQVRIALHGCGKINPENIDEALGEGAFQGLVRALSMKREDVIQEVLNAGLRGRGGGGFPTGKKWQFAYAQNSEEKYVVCNGDEGDPGAFMDRSILEGNPLNVIEGMMIAGYAIGAKNGYFYVRAEYPIAVNRLRIAIKQAKEIGLLGENILGTGFSFDVHIRLGAGAFVCGEETALLRSIEGQRGMPTPKPPFPAQCGLWGKPTVINNVETWANIPVILTKGADWFASIGTDDSKGTKVFALTGKVNNSGLVEVPMGTTLREIIFEIGGGIKGGKKFKGVQTGGPSGGIITEENLDTPIDFGALTRLGSMMGSGGMIVMDEDDCVVDVAKFYMEFCVDESCGKCSPCRIGTRQMYSILDKISRGNGEMEDIQKLKDIGQAMKSCSLCALGQSAPNPTLSTINKFEQEYIDHIQNKHCESGKCKKLISFHITEKCIGCGACETTCKFNAIEKK